MLLTQTELHAIKTGAQTRVYRRWKRPSVKTGGTLKTSIGLLAIKRVTVIDYSLLTVRDAKAAGHDSLTSLVAILNEREGDLYRIDVRYAGADPRIKLRENDRLKPLDLEAILAALARLDKASKAGPWTWKILRAVEKHPHVAAVTLAEKTGYEKEWLKLNVRKLKNLGLTISHEPGYELSPRGKAVMRHLT